MKRTVATVGLVCALMIGCMGMPPVRAAESDTDKVTTDIGTKVMPFEELSVEVVDSMSIPSVTRATSRIEWNISPDTVMKADTAYSLEADEIVTINCTYSPRTANLDFGFITQDDTFHFTSGSNGSIKTNIQIDKTGKYYFAVRNNENETVEVLGYYKENRRVYYSATDLDGVGDSSTEYPSNDSFTYSNINYHGLSISAASFIDIDVSKPNSDLEMKTFSLSVSPTIFD